MKKLICLLLALTMLLALCACGGAAAPATQQKPAETSPAASAAESESSAEPDAVEVVGVKEGNTYTSEFLGIQVELPENWYILNDEEVAEAMGFIADTLGDQGVDIAEQLRESGSTCDLYAMAQDASGDNMNIQLEDLGVLYGIALNEERYLDIGEPQLITALEQMGVENIETVRESFLFAGQERSSLYITGSFNGRELYQREVLIKQGRYMAMVTMFSFDADTVDGILGSFQAA